MKISLVRNLLVVCLTQILLYLGLFILIPHFLMRGIEDWIWICAVIFWTFIICSYTVLVLVPELRY